MAKYNLDTPVKDLIATPETNEVLKEVLPDLMNGPMVGMVKDLPMSFKQILKFANGQIPDEKVQELEQKLAGRQRRRDAAVRRSVAVPPLLLCPGFRQRFDIPEI